MSESLIKILSGIAVTLFIVAVFSVAKPGSSGGKLARKLCFANAIGWLILLPLSTTGHPPPFLMPGILFWLANLVLMPASAIALRVSHKERDERISYLAIAFTYVVMNIAILYVVPFVWLVVQARRL